MARQTEAGTPKAHLLHYLGLVALCCGACRGLEKQEWLVIRTADGTVIATSTSWEGAPVSLRTDFSKFFDDQFCESPAAVAAVNSLSNWLRPSFPFSPCDNAIKNFALRHAPHYGCPEPPQKRVYPCGTYKDFYCRQWGCETLAKDWTPGGGADKHITLFRDLSKGPGNSDCLTDKCNPVTVTVLHPGDSEWIKGRTWGIRLYLSGTDPGTFFTIRRLPTKNRPLLRGVGNGLPPRPPKPTVSLPAMCKRPKSTVDPDRREGTTPATDSLLSEPEERGLRLPFYSPSLIPSSQGMKSKGLTRPERKRGNVRDKENEN